MADQKILIIEDNMINLELAADLLQASGYVVYQASTAEEGLELASREQLDLILMDVGLPDMDGLQAACRLKQDQTTRHIPVVALTAHAMKGDEKEALGAGCAGYLTKPIDTRTFSTSVARFLECSGNGR